MGVRAEEAMEVAMAVGMVPAVGAKVEGGKEVAEMEVAMGVAMEAEEKEVAMAVAMEAEEKGAAMAVGKGVEVMAVRMAQEMMVEPKAAERLGLEMEAALRAEESLEAERRVAASEVGVEVAADLEEEVTEAAAMEPVNLVAVATAVMRAAASVGQAATVVGALVPCSEAREDKSSAQEYGAMVGVIS